ncbi:membrane protein [Micromonospora rhizosphaerae]|uniref:Membrane protein n=1 Tax=Micromonospora rhizosphaerae TaxID=568872 RepID=A0A1C6R817_9ACTN|nr:MmpS family transport accessory protein [Micromonospora rhizosphaerae]SCL13213.1 membrane protein [Micromonospora rhizosphaerae]
MGDGSPTDPRDPAATPWAPPDPPAASAEPTPVRTGDAPDRPGGPPRAGERRRPAGDGRTTTIVLSAFAVVVLAVCGLLAVVSLLVNLPVHPFGDGPQAREPRQEVPVAPAGSGDTDAGQARSEPPSPHPTPSQRPASTPSNGPGRFAVRYEVTGQGPVDIQYQDANGLLVLVERVSLPWHRQIRTDDPSQASVMAYKVDDKGGRSIACALTVDGRPPVAELTGDGGWRVTCGA